MRKTVKIIALATALLMLLSTLVSCGAKPMIEYGDKTLSVNVYEFLLTRMKGTLGYYGYDVESDSFWNTIVDMQGTTYDDYFRETIKDQAINYVVADKLFDEEGLTLSDEEIARVDKILAGYVEKAGSKSSLNAILKEYGVNYDILREVYILEAKMQALKAHLYGKEGEKIESGDKEKFFNESYVAFKQIFLATYEYVIDEDRFGDQVYYTDEKHKAIAYDTVNGKTKNDEFGKPIKDVLGNPEYFTEDGKIAYDRVNGVLGYVLTESGDPATVAISDEKKSELYKKAKEYRSACNGDAALFEEYIKLYDESEGGGVIYLNCSTGYYSAQNASAAYFDEISSVLKTLEAGECEIYESKYGYHVLCKYENEAGAYDKKENEDIFGSFYDDLIAYLFDGLCVSRSGDVVINEEVFDGAPSMKDVASNSMY